MEKLYPLYIACEKVSGTQPLLCGGNFTINYERTVCTDKTYFSVCTAGNAIVIHLICEHFSKAPGEYVRFYFDPKHNSRKFHNARAVQISSDGTAALMYYDYKLNFISEFDGFRHACSWDSDTFICDLELPFRFLNSEQNPDCEAIEYVGFNVFREGKTYSQWSGIPTDFTYIGDEGGGQGNGVLVFARNIKGKDPEKAAQEFLKENIYNYTRWEKTFVPGEIYSLMSEKKRSFTASIKRDDVGRARMNAETTSWGSAMKTHIVEVADFWASKSDDYIFGLMAAANPHAATPGQYYGDPLNGGNRCAFQMCLERPYEYYNPETREWWYNGKEITNPATGEKIIFSDDGSGFLSPEGFPQPYSQYMFTAAYRFFTIAALLGLSYAPVLEDKNVCPETTGSKYFHAVTNLAYAYILTGDRKYAYKALLILGRLAELIPYMNGGHGDGTIGDMAKILEPTTSEIFLYINYFTALDLVYEAIDEVDTDLRSYFQGRPDAEGSTRTEPFDIKKAVHEFIPHIINLCEINKPVTHDSSVRWISLEMLLASFLESDRLMDRVLYEGEYSFLSKMRNCYFRDGRYAYDSMEYQKIITLEMMLYPNNVYNYQYKNGKTVNLFEEKEFGLTKTIALYFKIVCGNLTSAFGDTSLDNREPLSENKKRGISAYTPASEIAYMRAGDSAEGKMLKNMISEHLSVYAPEELAGARVESMTQTINLDEAEINKSLLLLAVAPDTREYRKNTGEGQIQPPALMEDSQTSIFHAGTNAHNCKHLIMFAQPTAHHAHGDKLGLWLGAYGYHMMAGGGGYPYTWVAAKLHEWEWNSGNCMIVLVDGRTQENSYTDVKHHYEGKKVNYANMNNKLAYPGCHYERAAALISAPGGIDAYVLDLFHTSGGHYYDYNTSGIDLDYSRISFEGINENSWEALKGTMAGEDTELYSAPGYYWMKAVKKARLDRDSDNVSWSYHFGEAGKEAAALKIHTLTGSEKESLICTLGEMGGYEQGKSPWVPYIFHRIETGKPCTFTTILEPFEDRSFIKEIKRLELMASKTKVNARAGFTPSGVEILYSDNVYRDVVISVYNSSECVEFKGQSGKSYETDAQFVLLRYRNDMLEYAEALGFTFIKADGLLEDRRNELGDFGGYKGTISAIDYESGDITIELDDPCSASEGELEGSVAIFTSPDYQKASTYYLHGLKINGRSLSFTSDMPLVIKTKSWPRDEKDFGIGGKKTTVASGTEVVVDLKEGDRFFVENKLLFEVVLR